MWRVRYKFVLLIRRLRRWIIGGGVVSVIRTVRRRRLVHQSTVGDSAAGKQNSSTGSRYCEARCRRKRRQLRGCLPRMPRKVAVWLQATGLHWPTMVTSKMKIVMRAPFYHVLVRIPVTYVCGKVADGSTWVVAHCQFWGSAANTLNVKARRKGEVIGL